MGGHINGFSAARPLANIPLVWMLEKLEENGVELPVGWRTRFPGDPEAPSVGTWQGLAKFFLLRAPRVVGAENHLQPDPVACAVKLLGLLWQTELSGSALDNC